LGVFTVVKTKEARVIRLRQTGKNQRGNHFLVLSAFELFGSLGAGEVHRL
jgi:hypothetical protein